MNLNMSRLVAAAMTVGGLLFGVVATGWLFARIAELSRMEDPGPSAADFTGAAALFIGAWAVAMLIWGAAHILNKLEDLGALHQAGETGEAGSAEGPRSAQAAAIAEHNAHRLDELAVMMRDMRDISLLSEDERKLRAKTESETLVRQLNRDVPTLLREHNWQEALRRVQRARARFPSVPAWNQLAEQVEQARAQFETHDIETVTRELEDLTALNAWDRARTVVRELHQRHPESERVNEMVRRVEANINKAADEERARMMAKAQAATDARKWREALKAVEAIVEKYPRSPEARDLRHQLPTLRSNAEIQHRQQMEQEITNLIKQQRHAEALRMARELIGRYPDSPQANVLRPQVPKLEQKAGETW